jgi:hypothetical protein
MNPIRHIVSPIAIVLIAAGVSACSTDTSLSESDVKQDVSDAVEQETGTAPEDVSCSEEIEGEVGNTLSCTATAADGSSLQLSVEVTEVDHDQIKYDINLVG